MINRIKNLILRFNVIDRKKKDFWRIVIYITVFMISTVALISVLLVYLGMLPDIVSDTLCGWYTSFTRRQLDACN